MALATPPTTTSSSRLMSNPARGLAHSFNIRVIAWLLLHIGLAFLLDFSPWLSTAHAVLLLLFGLRAGMQRNQAQVLYVLGYIAGGDILWRMTLAHIPWEFGKYASVLIAVVAILADRNGRSAQSRTSRWPYLYFLLLIPAAIPLFFLVDFDRFTDQLSFILSGHLALVALSIFIWRQQFKRRQITRLLLYMIGPIICVATLTLYGTLTNQIVFTQESNFGTSAGFGPNQISNMLGLGAFIGTLLIVFLRRAPALRLIIGATTLVLMVQNALTFSRGGLFSFLLAVFAFILHVMHSRKARNWIAVGAVGLYLVGAFWLLPTLNDFTGGSIGQRFTDLDTSGRLEVAGGELQAFLDKPLTGVGVSLAASYRKAALGRIAPTHTEFTRLLGEHGLLGAASGLMLLAVCWQQYRRAQSGITRALVAAFLIWSLSVMTQSALRFVAPVFILSLAMADWNFVKRHKTIQAPAETGS